MEHACTARGKEAAGAVSTARSAKREGCCRCLAWRRAAGTQSVMLTGLSIMSVSKSSMLLEPLTASTTVRLALRGKRVRMHGAVWNGARLEALPL